LTVFAVSWPMPLMVLAQTSVNPTMAAMMAKRKKLDTIVKSLHDGFALNFSADGL